MKLQNVTGILYIHERMRSSANGNPRYCVNIGGNLYRTKPDSDFAYSVPNLENKLVSVYVREYHGWPTIEYGGAMQGTMAPPPVPDESIGCPESGTLDYALLLGFYEYLMVKPSKRQVVPRNTDWQLSYDNGAALARAYKGGNEEEE